MNREKIANAVSELDILAENMENTGQETLSLILRRISAEINDAQRATQMKEPSLGTMTAQLIKAGEDFDRYRGEALFVGFYKPDGEEIFLSPTKDRVMIIGFATDDLSAGLKKAIASTILEKIESAKFQINCAEKVMENMGYTK